MENEVIKGYAADAHKLIPRYEAVEPSTLFAPVAHLLPQGARKVIDIGAGTGAAAAWFAQLGQHVLAVEPVAAFRKAGKRLHKSPNIEWLDDCLPDLAATRERREVFDLVLLSAVWHHLDSDQRQRAMSNLVGLMAAGGVLVISLRKGPGALNRACYDVRPEELAGVAKAEGLQLEFCQSVGSVQDANRAAGVMWTWMVFRSQNSDVSPAAPQA